jgi:hypothetical protein
MLVVGCRDNALSMTARSSVSYQAFCEVAHGYSRTVSDRDSRGIFVYTVGNVTDPDCRLYAI